MKRFLVIMAMVLLFGSLALGQTVHYADQVTIAWDPVTKLADGTTPLPAGTSVLYEVYLKDGTQTKVVDTTATEYTITLQDYKKYDVGVVATYTDGGVKYSSDVTWGSVEGKPTPFVLQRYPAPAKVQNLRVE